MAELLHLAWASRSALISTCSSCNENSMLAFSISISNVWHRYFLQVLKTLANRTDGSYTSSISHIMFGPHQQETPQSSDTNQQAACNSSLRFLATR
ncbi:hypothetical protein T10_10042 [Trichinella papuae]|uniref:Uncharacterized protein n=1 Tax=Trichinella papuae TaxID=268474 RepID=A0A0V1MJP5_9BILA|nr:hypothetical protein T10_4667 [Trichinella papuae]KRZ72084.1 hypothetical protein T10_10042 [Trichinella papuae]